MMLHILQIGQQRNGRRASSWARAFRHPGLDSLKLHFKKKDGSALIGWKPVYLTDTAMTPDEWVDRMAAEGECERLMRHIVVNVPSDRTCDDTRQQIITEAYAMDAVKKHSWEGIPMSRGACDVYNPCVYQAICYSEKLVDINNLGIYKRVSTGTPVKETV
jgi:hypothetical protein